MFTPSSIALICCVKLNSMNLMNMVLRLYSFNIRSGLPVAAVKVIGYVVQSLQS